MLHNYLTVAVRSLLKFKGFAIINLLGLALGLTSGIFILMYVLDEISFDRFHVNKERIFRVGTDMMDIKSGARNGRIETNGWPIGALLEKDFPEVEKVVYLSNASFLAVNHEGKRIDERIFFAGAPFFEMFSFPLVKGDPASALSKPYRIVLTESMEKKYFGKENALGKTLVLADTLLMEVTGVMKDVPSQSHMQFGMLISFATYEALDGAFSYSGGWGNLNVRNYVLLKEGVDKELFFAKARNIYMDHVQEEMKKWGMFMYVGFEPLTEIYLRTQRGNGMGPLGSMDRIYLLSGIAAFVMLLACINFINLATARSTYRAKEVGLRKVVGSTRSSLVRQFMTESFLFTILSSIIAVIAIALLLPLFNQLLAKSYSLANLSHPYVLTGILLMIIIVSVLAGYYPSMILSAMRPAEVLKGNIRTGNRGILLRRFLVVFQFAISSMLMITTFVVIGQLDYMQNRDLGFRGEQIIVLDLDRVTDRGGAGSSPTSTNAFRNELKALSSVESITFTNALPGRPGWVGQWAYPAERPNEGAIGVEYMAIDEEYINTLGLTLVAGRNFDVNRPFDVENGLIINETCVQKMGWQTPENALGKEIDSASKHPAGTVIGVVKDYHEFGLQQQIYPMAMDYNPSRSRYFAIRFHAKETQGLLSDLQNLWKKHHEGYDLKYFFLNENFARQYQAEQRLAKVFTIFSVVAIMIAGIGLIGLISFVVISKTKEIGIRKILGANVLNISHLITKEFIILVMIANIISFPLAWYFSSEWLKSFAYRMSISPMLFVWTLMVALIVTLLTVSVQTIRAAFTDPVKSLRYE
jgi:putative ABC transport system permease protein